jgi:TetR/AcrR family transcriptional repressor of bet genes
MTRRSFHHASEDVRRQDLIAATLDCIADYGIQGATVRQIADRAGVTPGLIRHYFVSKELMFQAAYREVVNTMFESAIKAADAVTGDPLARFRILLLVNFQEPIVDQRMLSLWATFISQTGVDPALAAIHRESYLSYRDSLESLLADAITSAGRTIDADERRGLAIAINGLIDGLWLEGCMAGDLFQDDELARTALLAVERITGLKLQPDA